LLKLEHIAVHFRADRRASRKEKFEHIDFAGIIGIGDFLAVLVGKLELGRLCQSVKLAFAFYVVFYLVQVTAAHHVASFDAFDDVGHKNDPENQDDERYPDIRFVFHQISRFVALLLRLNADLYSYSNTLKSSRNLLLIADGWNVS